MVIRIFSAPEVFIRAEEKVADWIIALLEQWNREEKSYYSNRLLLGVLIYIPCERVARFLKQSSVEPLPLWTQNLNLLPIEFTQFAGWTVKEDGQIERLYEDEATVWSACDKKDASQEIPLCNLKTECPSCGERFSLIYRGKQNYVTCLQCACYDTVFIRQEAERMFWMGNDNSKSKEEMEIVLEEDSENILELDYGLSISNEKRLPFFIMSEWPDISHSQMGGLPTP